MRRRVDAMGELTQELADMENPALEEIGAAAVAALIGSESTSQEKRMERTPVTSSQIASIGYDPGSQRLEVAFKKGQVYEYFMVPQEKYDALMKVAAMKGESVGTFFAKEIRWKFTFAIVKQPTPAEPQAVASGTAFFTPDSTDLAKP